MSTEEGIAGDDWRRRSRVGTRRRIGWREIWTVLVARTLTRTHLIKQKEIHSGLRENEKTTPPAQLPHTAV